MEQNTPKFRLKLNLFDGIVILLANLAHLVVFDVVGDFVPRLHGAAAARGPPAETDGVTHIGGGTMPLP